VDLNELLQNIDFNVKGFSKALVHICGISVCVAGTVGKIASMITVNPALNDPSVRGMVLGDALAISPNAVIKLAEKLQFKPREK
jgi:hypothetical protein